MGSSDDERLVHRPSGRGGIKRQVTQQVQKLLKYDILEPIQRARASLRIINDTQQAPGLEVADAIANVYDEAKELANKYADTADVFENMVETMGILMEQQKYIKRGNRARRE